MENVEKEPEIVNEVPTVTEIQPGTIITDNVGKFDYAITQIVHNGIYIRKMVSIETPVVLFLNFESVMKLFKDGNLSIMGYKSTDTRLLELMIIDLKTKHKEPKKQFIQVNDGGEVVIKKKVKQVNITED